MTAVALMLLPFLVGPAFALPIDVSLGTGLSGSNALDYDYVNGYYGLAAYRNSWPYDTYGTVLSSDVLDYANPLAYGADIYTRWPLDYITSAFQKSVDYARENFVRGSAFGGTEVGTRDEFTVRPTAVRSPFSRYYASYYPLGYLRGVGMYPYLSSRSSLLGRIAGDTLYMK